jgi:hypothetical protein
MHGYFVYSHTHLHMPNTTDGSSVAAIKHKANVHSYTTNKLFLSILKYENCTLYQDL